MNFFVKNRSGHLCLCTLGRCPICLTGQCAPALHEFVRFYHCLAKFHTVFSFIFYSLFIGLWWLQSRVIAKKSWPRENIFPGTNPFLLNIMIIVSGQSLFKWSIMLSLKAICRLVKYDERQQEGFSLLSSNNDGLRAVPSGLVPNSVTSVFTLYAHY